MARKPNPSTPAALTGAQRQARLRERQAQRLAAYVDALEYIAQASDWDMRLMPAQEVARNVLEKWKERK